MTEATRGRFATRADRVRAILLNERGWYGCRIDGEWQESEPGEPCRICGEPLKAERRPDKGSEFEKYFERNREKVGV